MYKFFLREGSKKAKKRNLYFRVKIKGVSTAVCSGVEVDVAEFEQKSKAKRASTLDDYLKSINFDEDSGVTVYQKLADISEAVAAMDLGKADAESVKEMVNLVLNAEKVKRENKYREEKKKAKAAAAEKKRLNVKAYVDKFLVDIQEGRQTSRGEQYSYNTIRVWKQFQRVFSMFYKKNPFTWKDIDKTLVGKFQKFMEKDGQAKTTSGKYLGCFRTIIRFAYDDDVNDNPKSLRVITIKGAKEHEKATEVYLTDEEVRALYDMDLRGMKEKVRDVFLVGCFTAQRFSDYSRIGKDNFGVTDKGTEVLRIIQQKTKTKVVIPIFNDMLKTILGKYDYTMPDMVEQVLNRYIKIILHELSQSVPSLAKKETTLLMKPEREAEKKNENVNYERNEDGVALKEKWEMVTSHTARRTGATLMYLSGRYTIQQMMKITGHSTFKIFEEYIKLSGDEFADDILARKEREEDTF